MTTSVGDLTTQAAISAIVAAHRGQRGSLLPILWNTVPKFSKTRSSFR